jgi:HSP20 family protein
MSILRWDPVRELRTMRRTLERMMDELMGAGEAEVPEVRGEVGAWQMPVEMYETDTEYVVRAALPGVDPKSIDVEVADDSLRLAAERHEEKEERGRNYLRRELRYGLFQRTLPLPGGVKADQAKAAYKDGVLEVHVPKTEQAQARKVQVQIQT